MTKQIQRATVKEIAEEMRGAGYMSSPNGPGDPYINNAVGFKVLTEDLWGVENGVYQIQAKLSLPVLYGGDNEGPYSSITTSFDENFLNGYFPEANVEGDRDNNGLPIPLTYGYMVDGEILNTDTTLGPESTLRQHIANFLSLHRTSQSGLVKSCLQEF